MKRAILVLSLLVTVISALGQKTNAGTEFWLGFLQNYTSVSKYRLFISATTYTKVVLSVPLQAYSETIYIQQDSVAILEVPDYIGFVKDYDLTIPSAIQITSDYPVSVTAMNLQKYTTDASIIYPTSNIPSGATYVIGNPQGQPNGNEAMMVCSSDSTSITITPRTKTSGGHPANIPYTIRLNKGELYQIRGNDLNGSIIQVNTNSKVAVFSGDICSNFPCGACDHQFEQILPNNLVDTSYYVPPLFGHTKGYFLRIVPLDSNISIQVNDKTYNSVSRLSPLMIDVKGDSGYYIRSDKLFHVFQFMKGSYCNGYITNTYGDPSMLEIISNKYMGNSSRFCAVNSTFLRDHFVSIVINTSSKNQVYLDKTQVSPSEFKPFPYDNKRSYACIKISLGTHLIECSEGMLAYCYGLGDYESYMYLAGFNLPKFDLDFRDSGIAYDCKNTRITFQFKAEYPSTLKKYTWLIGDNITKYGNPITHTFDSVGKIRVTLIGETYAGLKDTVSKMVRIGFPEFDPVRNKIICGDDTVRFEERNPFFTNFKWQDSSTNNYHEVWDNKKVWVYATDTSGYCTFTDTGVINKINILSYLRVDSLDKCFESNLFRFSDSSKTLVDQVDHKAWVFPFATYWDQDKIDVKFPMPGKYKVYFDVYTQQVNCKARYPIDITVHPNPRSYPYIYGDFFCTGNNVFFKDSSIMITGHIDSTKWIFDDNTTITSDSLRTYKKFHYNPANGEVTRFYKQISYSDHACTDTVVSAVNVWPSPVSGFSISPDTIKCLPNAFWSFKSTTFGYYDTFSLHWDAGNGQQSTAKNMNILYKSPGIHKIKLIAKSDQYGCLDSTVKFVEVLDFPKAQMIINDTVQCINNSWFNFRDSSYGKYLKQFWTLDSISSFTGKTLDSISIKKPGQHKIRLIVQNQYDSTCSDTIERMVHVENPPVSTFSSNKDTLCFVGNQFKFTNKSQFPRKYLSSLWLFEDGGIYFADTNFNPPTYSAKDTGDFNILLIVRDIENCSDTFTRKIRVEPHTFSPLTINDDVQCLDSNRFLLKTRVGPGESKIWKIDQIQVAISQTDSLEIEVKKSGTHTAQVVGKNQSGCIDSSSKTFTVLAALKTEISINNDSQCIDRQAFEIMDVSNPLDDQVNYWKYIVDDTLIIESKTTGPFQLSKAGQYLAKLIIHTEENCKDTGTAVLTVLPLPSIQVIGDTICLNEPAILRAINNGHSTIVSWNWLLGDGKTANTQQVNHVYASEGKFNLQVSANDEFGCIGKAEVMDAVFVKPIPDASFDINILEFGINQVRLTFIPSNFGYTNYQWVFPDGTSSILDTPSLIFNTLFKGETRLVTINEYGCVDTSYKYNYIYPNNFNVYLPNAITVNGDLLNEQFKPVGIGATKTYLMRIYNRWGEEIFYTEDPEQGWDGTYQNEKVQQDVYTYYIEFTFVNGKVYRFKGTLTVLR